MQQLIQTWNQNQNKIDFRIVQTVDKFISSASHEIQIFILNINAISSLCLTALSDVGFKVLSFEVYNSSLLPGNLCSCHFHLLHDFIGYILFVIFNFEKETVAFTLLLMDFHCSLTVPSCLNYESNVLSLPADNPDKVRISIPSCMFVQIMSSFESGSLTNFVVMSLLSLEYYYLSTKK